MPTDPIVPPTFPKVRERIDPATKERERWPIEPVVKYMIAKWGIYDQNDNKAGYCSAVAELHTGIHRTSWQRYVKRGWLTAEQADQVATRLGRYPNAFWPDYSTSITPDDEWLGDWDDAARRLGII